MRRCVIIELTVNHCTDTPFGSSQYKKPLSLRLSKMKGKVWKFDNRKKRSTRCRRELYNDWSSLKQLNGQIIVSKKDLYGAISFRPALFSKGLSARFHVSHTSSRDGSRFCSHSFGALLLCPRINICTTTGFLHHSSTAPLASYPKGTRTNRVMKID